MKRLLLLAVALPTLLVGCATNTYDRADSAAKSLQYAANQVDMESHQLTFTMSALDNLVNRPAADLRPQFKQFSQELDRLDAAARRNDKAAESASRRNAAYLQSWDNQITNMNYEVVRTHSKSRRAEVAEGFAAVDKRYAEARTAMEPLLSYLFDIRRALSSDLTVAGLDSIKPVVSNAVDNSKKVQSALGKLNEELAKAGARVSAITVQTAANQSK